MNALLLAVVWVHLAASALLTGALSLLLMAGLPASPAMRRWEAQVVAAARWLVLLALLSNLAWLLVRTALFEGRPAAAIDPRSVARAMFDTWPGIVWMLRQGLLVVLAAVLWLGADTARRRDWLAVRGETFLLAVLALVLIALSGHAAAISTDLWPRIVDMVHLLAAGVWVGGLPALALLLIAGRRDGAPDAQAVRAMRRFSAVALAAVLALAATGTATALLLAEGVPGLVGTTHGRLLLAKLALLAPALLLAAASRALLPRLSDAAEAAPAVVARRMAWFVALESGLVLLILGLAAAMTVTTPARHGDPSWPLPLRLVLDTARDPWLVPAAAFAGLVLVLAALFAFRQRLVAATLVVLTLGAGAAFALRPLAVEAFPTSFAKSPVTYNAASLAAGGRLFAAQCGSCHDGGAGPDLAAATTRARTAGELFWLIDHDHPDIALDATQRWDLVNHIRALDAARDPRTVGPTVDPENGWLVAPDFTIAVGPLPPRSLRDFRGTRMVHLVLYDLPASRERMTELARRSLALSVLGVEVVAVSPRSSPQAIAALGDKPPVYFPVVTAGNEDIAAAYRLFAPGSDHAEFLIDRQGYIRAVWRSGATGMPDAGAVQAAVEQLNAERAPPALPDDHVH